MSIDASERELQRPVKTEKQKIKYSGKKKTHTDKNVLLVNENTSKVVYLSATVEGKKHDKKLADERPNQLSGACEFDAQTLDFKAMSQKQC